MRYMIASSRSTASSFSDLLHQEKLRGLKAAGIYNIFIFPMPCGSPQDPLAGSLDISLLQWLLGTEEDHSSPPYYLQPPTYTAVFFFHLLSRTSLHSYSTCDPTGTSVLRQGAGEGVDFSECTHKHASLAAAVVAWLGRCSSRLIYSRAPVHTLPQCCLPACLPATGAFQSVSIFIT